MRCIGVFYSKPFENFIAPHTTEYRYIWSFIYFFIWQTDPHSFKISDLREYELQPWNLAMYFSLITLTTIGYGDIIPTGRWVMALVNFEAMAGAIYLTVIVARLVSLYGNSES